VDSLLETMKKANVLNFPQHYYGTLKRSKIEYGTSLQEEYNLTKIDEWTCGRKFSLKSSLKGGEKEMQIIFDDKKEFVEVNKNSFLVDSTFISEYNEDQCFLH
jgi:hypothetical protein